MPFIETKRKDISALRGVHLFHFSSSNCSQRVRFVLEEKRVAWESHQVNLAKCENATSEFIALNPRGVVPVLVHNGKTIIESNDIIKYVDEHFDGSVLSPRSGPDMEFLEASLERSSRFHVPFKLIMYEFLFKPIRRMNERELEAYAAGTQRADLIDFMTEFSSKEGFSRERITAALTEVKDAFSYLEARLETKEWLTGDEFGLTDISWVVNLHRFRHMYYPLDTFPRVQAWLKRMEARPAFDRAITQFDSKKVVMFFKVYSMMRRLKGTSVRNYLPK